MLLNAPEYIWMDHHHATCYCMLSDIESYVYLPNLALVVRGYASKRYRCKLVFRYLHLLELDSVYIVNEPFLLNSRLLYTGCFLRRNI